MKIKIILSIATILFTVSAYSQTNVPPDGAAGLKFGMSPSEVKAIWKNKGTLYQDYETIKSTIGSLSYIDISVGNEKFDVATAKFVNNKLYEISVMKLPEREAFAQGIYDNLQEILNNKYKKGNSYRIFTGIYEDGDGYEMQAVRLGNADIATYWDYSPTSIISLKITPLSQSIIIEMNYQSVVLFKDVDKIIKAANTSEF